MHILHAIFHCIIIFEHRATISTTQPCTKLMYNINAMKNASSTHTINMQNFKACTSCNDNCLPTFKAYTCNDHGATTWPTFNALTCKPTILHYYQRHWCKCTGLIMPLEHALQCMKVLPKHCCY